MTFKSWAENELDLLGIKSDDPASMDFEMRKCILDLLDVFSEQGHSGMSAPYAIKIFAKLASWDPLTPLLGTDDEWNEIGDNHWQSRRSSDVFKDKDGAYWSEGVVFWDWYSSPDIDGGIPFKSYFTSKDSRVRITFPWTKPDKPEYRERIK